MQVLKRGDLGYGKLVSRDEPVDEAPHFHTCSHCQQAVDRRDLAQVLHHEQVEHQPMQLDA